MDTGGTLKSTHGAYDSELQRQDAAVRWGTESEELNATLGNV